MDTKVHFIRITDEFNGGDMACGPNLYFKDFMRKYICVLHDFRNIHFDVIDENDVVIIGGGGILGFSAVTVDAVNRLLNQCKTVIAWSPGHNVHYDNNADTGTIDYHKFRLLSVRDYQYNNLRYLPCVSCMNPLFDANYSNKRRIGIIEHRDIPINEFDYDRITNYCMTDTIIEFIGSSEIIITNSYHCAYWGQLLNKKVIVYKPFSNRFDYFKYPQTIYSGDLFSDISKSEIHDDYLAECRDMNIAFKNEVEIIIEETIENNKKRKNAEREIRKHINNLICSKLKDKRVVIYGCGEHTRRLLELINDTSNIVAITGVKKLFDTEIPFVAKNELNQVSPEVVIVSSYRYRDEMKRELMAANLDYVELYDYLAENGVVLEGEFYGYF